MSDPWFIFFAAFIVACVLLSIRKPGVAFALMLTMFGLENFLQTQSSIFVRQGQLINFSVGIVLLTATTFSVMRNRSLALRPNKVHMLSLALFGLAMLSFVWTPTPGIFRLRWIGSIPYLGLFLVLGPIITQEKGTIRDGLRWTMYIGIPLLGLSAFYCQWGVRGMILAEPIIIGERLSYEALPLAIASCASYIGIIALIIHMRLPLGLFFRLAILGVAIYVALRTRSRGQVVAIVAVAATVYPISNKIGSIKGILISVFGLALFAAIIYFIVGQLDLMRWRTESMEIAMVGRKDTWVRMLQVWLETFDLRIAIGLGSTSSFKHVGFYPHNLPVEILTELGLVGIGIFLSILWISLVNAFKLLSRLNAYPEIRSEILCLIGLLALSLFLCQKEGSLYTWHILFFFAICLSQKEQQTRKAIARDTLFKKYYYSQQNHGSGYGPPQRTPGALGN